METNQIIDKVESGEFTKGELESIVKACAVTTLLQNYKEE